MNERPRFGGRLRVLGSETVTPRMLRLTMSVVEAHLPVDTSCPNLVVRLALPADRSVTPLGARPPSRTYTVRHYVPASATLDVDVVLHGDGPFVRWAQGAAPGDTIDFTGPRPHAVPSFDADALFMVSDQTGLPALQAVLEAAPAGLRTVAIVEVADAAEEQPVPTAAELDLHWLHRAGAPPGTTGALERAVRDLDWPDGHVEVWAAGETGEVRAIRRLAVGERGVPREALHVFGYWRRGHAGSPS
ncbi:NADPH-dependent ferric siderophore reductase [Haloactinopolyspora alba]|uniref:NADPH-dependent ferric siderophore reductase n=1 Tax=Haloactinopolyspora alba TaxID=648780 RepID=A0A2P8DYU4_9ACTN|nr:siderophore-interacting protein [Haloactinopolyspora alba]PSL02381.1 NADPH-dependent ferric siderophore reductase [Haloactinopolyspora alba]